MFKKEQINESKIFLKEDRKSQILINILIFIVATSLILTVVLINCDGFRLMCNKELRLMKENNLLTTESYGGSELCEEGDSTEIEFYPVEKSVEDTFPNISEQQDELDLYKTTSISPDIVEEYHGSTFDDYASTIITAPLQSVTVPTPENNEDIENDNLKVNDYTFTDEQISSEIISNENYNVSSKNIKISEEVASITKNTPIISVEENNSTSLEMPYSENIEIIQREDIYPTIQQNITENNHDDSITNNNNNNEEFLNTFLERNETELGASNTEIKSYKNPFDTKLIKFGGSTVNLHELANKNLKRDLDAGKLAHINTNSIVSEKANAFLNATSAERAEIISKAIDRFVQVINIFGQVDSYFTGRVKSSIKRLAKLCEDDGPFL